jgi:hypothetical protein
MPKMPPPTMQQMDAALHQTLDEIDALKAENARLQAKLDGLMEAFDKNGSLGILQQIAYDKNLPVEIRLRALNILMPYERPKYGTVDGLVIQGDLKQRVYNARMRTYAQDKAKWEAEQAKVIELQPTILGESDPVA